MKNVAIFTTGLFEQKNPLLNQSLEAMAMTL